MILGLVGAGLAVGGGAGALAVQPVAASAAEAAEPEPAPREVELKVGAPAPLVVGQTGALSLTVAPAPGRRIDRDAPFSLRISLAPAAGLVASKRRYALADAADPRAEAPRFDLGLEARTVGDYRAVLDLRLWVCAAKTCVPVRETLAVPISVIAPTSTGAADAGPAPR